MSKKVTDTVQEMAQPIVDSLVTLHKNPASKEQGLKSKR